jgi:FkbM family methyltransferase
MKSTVLDIGANVGNHSLFYAMHTAAAFVYPFEPNLFARKILVENIAANTDYRAEIRAEYTHLAVGRTPASLSIAENPHNNLGGTRFTCAGPEDQNSVQCAPLDNLTFEGVISFLKIDVEGMELDVLSGAENMIEKHRPVIVIEISGV